MNQTMMGLKHVVIELLIAGGEGGESDHDGIETSIYGTFRIRSLEGESDHDGIETTPG